MSTTRTATLRGWWSGALGALLIGWLALAATRSDNIPARNTYFRQLDSLSTALRALDAAATTLPIDSARLYTAFHAARDAYKKTEWWMAATDSGTAAAMDMPILEGSDEMEDEADDAADSAEALARGIPLDARTGLQGVELFLYSRYATVADAAHAIRPIVVAAEAAVDKGRHVADTTAWTDERVFDAIRDELARVDALGLAGFDATRSGSAMQESGAAVAGICDVLGTYRAAIERHDATLASKVENECRAARMALVAAPNFNAFDRAGFLVDHAAPLAYAIASARAALGVTAAKTTSVWRNQAATLFDKQGFDPWAFAPPDAPKPNQAELALGHTLFNSPTVGGNSGRSCAFCHQAAHAFTDGLVRNAGAVRHTPTLLNATLQPRLFMDLRATTLEDQVTDVIGNPHELGGLSVDSVAVLLRHQPDNAARFAAAFGDSAITAARVRWALAAYERTLVRLDSRFDQAMRGHLDRLTTAERRGFNLFMGKAHCGTCHFLPLFNGVAPPDFAASEIEVLGVPRTADTIYAAFDKDVGRFDVTHNVVDLYAFRVPTVRNAAVSGPYMHNGVYRTLDQVVDFYNRGGGEGIGARLMNQTLPIQPLHLTRTEENDIVAFLKSLTDTTATPAIY